LQTTFLAHDLARCWLLWPERPAPSGGKSVTDPLKRRFREHLAVQNPRRHDDDIELAVEDFFRSHPLWPDWWKALLPDFPDFFDFHAAEPRVRQGRLACWRAVSNEVDADALVALALALRGQAGDVARLAHWGVYVRGGAEDLARLLAKGVAEPHAHLAACNPVSLLWLRVMGAQPDTQPARISKLDRYKHAHWSPGSALPEVEREQRRKEMEAIERARDEWRPCLVRALKLPPPHPGKEGLPLAHSLMGERCLLAAAWQAVLSKDEKVREEVLGALDRYLVTKSRFLHHHQQTGENNPGLTRFRRYLDAGRLAEPAWASSLRVRMADAAPQLDLAAESRSLQHLELRIAPLASLRDYEEFFRLIDKLRERPEWRKARRQVNLSFIVHFIRRGEDRPDGSPCPKQRREMDRRSAILHLYRCRDRKRSGYIKGIDVANFERPSPPYCFAPLFKLLRGEVPDLENLDAAGLHHWARLVRQKRANQPVHLPRLAATYHVGEDFFHPVDGMRHMWDLVEHVGFRAGDRFGHSLAPGINLTTFHRERVFGMLIPQGVLLDSAAWLLHRVRQLDGARAARLADLCALIDHLCRDIYGEHLSSHDLTLLQKARYFIGSPRQLAKTQVSTQIVDAWSKELLDTTDTWKSRNRLAKPEDTKVFFGYEAEMAKVQDWLIGELGKTGIVVEFNPSSNLATGAVSRMAEHPACRYIQVQGNRLSATLGTDDPGVFATRIENEYELLFEALLENNYDRRDALEVMEQLRVVGCEVAAHGFQR